MKALLLAGAVALAATGTAVAGLHAPHPGPHFNPHEHFEHHGGPHEWHGGPGFHGHGFRGDWGHRYFYNDRWYDWGEGPCLRVDPYTGDYVWICG